MSNKYLYDILCVVGLFALLPKGFSAVQAETDQIISIPQTQINMTGRIAWKEKLLTTSSPSTPCLMIINEKNNEDYHLVNLPPQYEQEGLRVRLQGTFHPSTSTCSSWEIDITQVKELSEPCLVYALHDDGVNNSQLLIINPYKDFEVKALGELHRGYDLEGLDIHPRTKELYATSGDDTAVGLKPGYLYRINNSLGTLNPICDTGLGEVSAISFHPIDHTLWVWGEGQGLFTLDIDTCEKTEKLLHSAKIEDMTWDNEGKIVYGVEGTVLYKYFHETGQIEVACNNFASQVEALEMLADDSLLYALHKSSDNNLYSFDIGSCSLNDHAPIDTSYSDIEGVTWTCEEVMP